MEAIKKIFGIVWIALGLYGGYYLINNYGGKLSSAKSDEKIQAIVFLFVLVPIITGSLLRFGIFALQGEYNDDEQ